MNKLIVMVLAVVMLLSMAATASAATIKIVNPSDDLVNEVYRVADYVADASGNKWYKVKAEWKDVLSQVFNLDNQDYIVGYKSGKNDSDFAEAVTDWLKDPTVGQDGRTNYERVAGTQVALDATNVPLGYYVLVTKDADDGEIYGNIGSAALNKENDVLSIRQKNMPDDLPKIEKTMSGLTADYTVGDEATFTITVTCEEGATSYTIHDQMEGMELVDGSIQVVFNPASTATTVVNTTGIDCTFEIIVTFPDSKPAKAYDQIIITYKASVTEAGFQGISNKAWIDMGNEPDIETPEIGNDPTTYTVKKTAADSTEVLKGAVFQLSYKQTVDGVDTYVPVKLVKVTTNGEPYYRPAATAEEEANAVSIEAGYVTIKGLDPNKAYYLEETQAPAGYVPIDGYRLLSETTTIENVKASELPNTGGIGTTLFYVIGGAMFLGAAVLLVTKKRMAA